METHLEYIALDDRSDWIEFERSQVLNEWRDGISVATHGMSFAVRTRSGPEFFNYSEIAVGVGVGVGSSPSFSAGKATQSLDVPQQGKTLVVSQQEGGSPISMMGGQAEGGPLLERQLPVRGTSIEQDGLSEHRELTGEK